MRFMQLVALAFLTLPLHASPMSFSITDAPRTDLSTNVEWCESKPDVDISAIASGGCQMQSGTTIDLERNLTKKSVWLHLILVNPGSAPIERWLQIGHPRLTRVSFFEQRKNGWKRSDTGMAVPISDRPVRTIEPILPVMLAPHEHRAIFVRITTTSAMNGVPILWSPSAYYQSSQRDSIYNAIGLGALIASAIFLFAIYIFLKTRSYLYLACFTFCTVLFSVTHSGQMQLYFWPDEWPFDIRIQILPGIFSAIFFALFASSLMASKKSYPRHHALIMILAYATLLASAWTCLVDYQSGIMAVVFLGLATFGGAASLLLRGWPKTFDGLHILLFIIAAFAITRAITLAVGVSNVITGNELLIRHIWVFLMACMPAVLLGLTMHRQRMQNELQATQAESAARVSFLARMSHELRTPLDIIIGTSQLLSRPSHRGRLEEGLADISANGRQLLKMIDEVLDYSRGIIGKLTIITEPVDWPEFLKCMERDAKILAARNGNAATLTVNGAMPSGVSIDEKRLKQILDNLITNAARHTKNGWIKIDCNMSSMGAEGKYQIQFAISDSGDGIASADMERIFRPFERGGNTTQHGGKGVGMGLAISRQLVELMGGTLTVESAPGKGACFRFQITALPTQVSNIKKPLEEGIRGYSGERKTLLVVDDESGNRGILTAMLREAGFTVLEAENGNTAITLCSGTSVDAILTDQFMPDGDGWFVLRNLGESYPSLPVILISAAPPDRPNDFPPELHFADALLKPLNHSEVLRCIGAHLNLIWIQDSGESQETLSIILSRPSDEEIRALRALIEAGRISDIVSWADEIISCNPQLIAFAERVKEAALDLDFEQLEELSTLSKEAV